MIAISMNGNYESKKHWADKVALLLLFIAALLIARLIVISRSAITLSEPIRLDYGGLSVSIPTGNGWQNGEKWKYQENAFVIGSFLTTGPDNVSALVSCRYQLMPSTDTTEALFEEKASAVGGVIADKGQLEKSRANSAGDTIIIDWVHVKTPKTLFDTFFGVAQMPSRHQLDIEVYQGVGETDLAEEVFKAVVNSLEFTDTRLLENGHKVVTEIKTRGLDSFLGAHVPEASSLSNRNREAFFLIKDTSENPIGFTMDVLGSRFAPAPEMPRNDDVPADAAPKTQLNMLAANFYYIRSRYDNRQAALFQSDNSFDKFVWKSETHTSSGSSGTEMILDKEGIMTVRKVGRRPEEKLCQISFAAIPDILGELIFSQMLDGNQKEIFIDIISNDSDIIPAFISRIEKPQSAASQHGKSSAAFVEDSAYAFRVNLLNGKGFSEQVYLDSQGQIQGRLLQQESIYTVERTDTENILSEFPEQGGYILQRKNDVFGQNQPPENSE